MEFRGVCLYDHMIIDHALYLHRYNEEHHNCLDFVVAVLSAIFCWDCSRHTLSQLMLSHVRRAKAYERLYSLLGENEGVYVMNGNVE